jgi:hypothetical protein
MYLPIQARPVTRNMRSARLEAGGHISRGGVLRGCWPQSVRTLRWIPAPYRIHADAELRDALRGLLRVPYGARMA